jgi:hypothetical protein
MPVIESEELGMVDTAIGPMATRNTVYSEYDIDDFFHDVVTGQATQLRMYNAAQAVDTRYTDNRLPVNVGDVSVGGFNNV